MINLNTTYCVLYKFFALFNGIYVYNFSTFSNVYQWPEYNKCQTSLAKLMILDGILRLTYVIELRTRKIFLFTLFDNNELDLSYMSMQLFF